MRGLGIGHALEKQLGGNLLGIIIIYIFTDVYEHVYK